MRPFLFPQEDHVYTVSEITSRISELIRENFRNVVVEGEISNLRLYPSGHLYFTLKDDFASLRAVIFNFSLKYPDTFLKDGISVVLRGRIDLYEKRGEYQLIVEEVEVKGIGAFFQRFEILKRKLFQEGLFEEKRKKPIPFLPERIGIITSPVGAAIRDMLKIIGKKFENMHVLIYPVRVQGTDAALEIVEGIEYFNRTKSVDVIIIARGGGSIEDLEPFNEEVLARAIYDSQIPIVTGIGHEIDYTIADFVADVRSPTPTAAADTVVKDRRELKRLLEEQKKKLAESFRRHIEKAKRSLEELKVKLKEKKDFIDENRMYLDELSSELTYRFRFLIERKKKEFASLQQRLLDLNPEMVLKRGYSITMKENGKVVLKEDEVKEEERLLVRLYRGKIIVSVLKNPSKT